ncbi:MAG: hypothetical protein WBD16_02370 [Pyrinomonadaceae bacterium]
MSKNLGSILLVLAAFVAILQFFTDASGQSVEATINIDPNQRSVVKISGKTASKSRNLSFLRSLAGIDNLGERVSDVSLFDDGGNSVTYKKFVAGEYVADTDFTSWTYKIDLTPPRNRTAAAHLSWLTSENGLLMLGDVLPIFGKGDIATSAKVKMTIPKGWLQMVNRIDDIVETKDVASEVVAVGKNIRFRKVTINETVITICIAGEWLFTSDDITNFARDIYAETRQVFGADMSNEVFINVFRFPQDTSIGQWEAETRGQNVTVISSDMPFKSQSLQRLHEQLRHEIFHLWLPNGVNLSGQYDWFYEGFALYRSLKLGVAVNRIRFEDFLDTLARVYDIDRLSAQKTSLIDASKNRWAGANTRVYARGMLVAFLCDVAMLDASKGKRSAESLLRELYEKHRPPSATTDANAAILTLMKSRKELVPIVERYVTGSSALDWTSGLQKAGIDATTRDQLTRLATVAKPSGRQKDLLDKLGYNSWRKLGNSKQ